jgi:hypothetical protein
VHGRPSPQRQGTKRTYRKVSLTGQVKVDLFVDRIAKEFDKLVELRRQDQPKAKGEHMQLYDEGQLYVEAFRSVRMYHPS